ncbi:uncharacterized protein FFNC_15541 [Fusarium fujikuroi]|nr:uncharacterized protein FFNC_15541 [Fusarium fujikuroi]
MMPSNTHSDNLTTTDPAFVLYRVDDLPPWDPLGAFLSRQHGPEYSRPAMLSSLCVAAIQNDPEKIRDMHDSYQDYIQRELDRALFLANSQGHTGIAAILESYHANPGRKSSANGLHGAAWSGTGHNIQRYIESFDAKPDVTDGSSATPIIYAILGIQAEEYAWGTIQFLLGKGASAWTKFGSEELSYEEIARREKKKYLAQKFGELGPCPSPTILNSSRESSCTVGRDDVDNEELRDDPEVDGGASLSRESSCTVGSGNGVQPNNKRPREDSEVDGGAKRVRGA